ncbi:MAG: glycosyltransferase [Vicinamibacterales bacterium]
MSNIEWNRTKWNQAAAWEHEYRNGYAWGGPESVDRWMAKHVLPWLPQNQPIDALEIACGMGRFSDRLLPHVSSLHAIDLAEVCVEGCRKRFAQQPAFAATLTDGKSLPEGSFDLIVSFDSLVHADRDVLDAYFHQMPSRLRPGGVVIINHANHFDFTASRMAVTHEDVQRMIRDAGGLELLSQALERWTVPVLVDADGTTRHADYGTFIDCVTVARRTAGALADDPGPRQSTAAVAVSTRRADDVRATRQVEAAESPVPSLEQFVESARTVTGIVDEAEMFDCLRAISREGRRIVIWGAGSAGARCITRLTEIGVAVTAFIDRDQTRHGQLFQGRPVRSPADVLGSGEPRPFVVIASLFAPEIEAGLIRAGWNPLADLMRFPLQVPMQASPANAVHPASAVCGPSDVLQEAWQRAIAERTEGETPATVIGRFVRHACEPAGPARKRIVLTLHEASRTGAPLIGLELARWFRRIPGIDLSIVVARGGPLVPELAECGPVVDVEALERSGVIPDPVTAVCNWIADAGPSAVICNSAETWPFASAFSLRSIPVLTLMHEYADAYPVDRLRDLFTASGRVVFPAEVMRRRAAARAGIDASVLRVAPQGLLPGRRPSIDRAVARRTLLEELRVPEDTFVVLGCGVVGPRKGADLVPQIAARVRAYARGRQIVFTWLGAWEAGAGAPMHWIAADMKNLDVRESVVFLGERSAPEHYFVGADAFLLTSREDPFPCVVHEAMAAGLPVVAFAGSGGAPEALDMGAGVVVPYADLDAAAAAIVRLASDHPHYDDVRGRAIERVRTEYDFDRYGRTLVSILRDEMTVDLSVSVTVAA